MQLRTVLEQLAFGEFSQLSLVNQTTGQIPEAKYPSVVAHINLGLTDLFKRFKLKEGRTPLVLVPNQLLYRSKTPDLFKIEQVFTDQGKELPLNKLDDEYSLHTPSMTSLRVPASIVNQAPDLPEEYRAKQLEVVYRANHCAIDASNIDLEQELELPLSHLWALLLFVASRVHNPIGLGQEFNAGNTYAAKYEAECQRLALDGMQVEATSESTRFERNGWV